MMNCEYVSVGVTSAIASFSWATYPDTLIISILSLRGSGMVSITLAVQINRILNGADERGRLTQRWPFHFALRKPPQELHCALRSSDVGHVHKRTRFYLWQIYRNIQVVVQEVGVLFGVQQLQQGRGWIALVTAPHLVHLVRDILGTKLVLLGIQGSYLSMLFYFDMQNVQYRYTWHKQGYVVRVQCFRALRTVIDSRSRAAES